MIEPRSRGLLDPRMREDDSSVWSRTIPVIASEAKQSILSFGGEMDCFASLAMTEGMVHSRDPLARNDGEELPTTSPRSTPPPRATACRGARGEKIRDGRSWQHRYRPA